MGRKKRKIEKPWCWYCNREFDDDKILVQHQKAKHFKCHICHKKLFSGPGLSIHCMQVHKETIDKIPGALPGRDNVQMEIYGMQGIPYGATRGEESEKKARTEEVPPLMPPFFPPMPGMPPLPAGMPPMPGGAPFMPPLPAGMPPMPPFPGGGGPMPAGLPPMPAPAAGGAPGRPSQFFPPPPRGGPGFGNGSYEGAPVDYAPPVERPRRSRFDQGPPPDMPSEMPPRDNYYEQRQDNYQRQDDYHSRDPYGHGGGGGYEGSRGGYPKEEPYYPHPTHEDKYAPPVAAAPSAVPTKLGAKTKIVHPDDYSISLEERRALEELRYR